MLKCKYCGEDIGRIVPEPLTCWACYRKLKNGSNPIKPLNNNVIHKAEDIPTRKCEMCGRTLPLSNFYRTGNTHLKNCKECMVKDKAQKSLDDLKAPMIIRMAKSGITATLLSKEWNKTRNTTQHYLSDLVKAGYGYKKEINGVHTYFLKRDLADKLINDRNVKVDNEGHEIVKQPLNRNNVLNNPKKTNEEFKTIDEATKKCEMCGRTLPLNNFYKSGNTPFKKCKECIIKDSAQKFLDTLNIVQIEKMAQSGIKSNNLLYICKKTHKTCLHYLNNIIKSGYGYKREVNGIVTFFINKDVAKILIKEKKIDQRSEVKAKVKKPKSPLNVNENLNSINKLKIEDTSTKKCEMCGRTLPIINFHRTGNSFNEKCKECVVQVSARRCLEHLSTSDIKKMVTQGITAKYLSNKINRSRSTCQALLNDLYKTNNAYKKQINGTLTFFIHKNNYANIMRMKNSGRLEIPKKSPDKFIESSVESLETKKCVVCKKILPVDEFYKMGNTCNKMCKSCVREENSRRCLESLSHQQITKMSNTGVTAKYLAKELGKTRSTCQSMLASLVKTGDAYKKVINGKSTYFMYKKKADNLLQKKSPQKNQYSLNKKINENPLSQIQSSHAPTVSIFSDVSSEGMVLEKMPNQGLLIKNLDIHHLGSIIQEIRRIDPDFNFEILTKGNKSQIFLSENLLLRFAYKNIGDVLKNYE